VRTSGPPGNPARRAAVSLGPPEADDGGRTRDLKLGKLALYQLSYVRVDGDLTDSALGRAEREEGLAQEGIDAVGALDRAGLAQMAGDLELGDAVEEGPDHCRSLAR
jgi:hypothetical protein